MKVAVGLPWAAGGDRLSQHLARQPIRRWRATDGVPPHRTALSIRSASTGPSWLLLRHGAMRWPFTGVRAPSTVGTFPRTFTFGHVRQLDAVASRLLIKLCRCPPLLPGADALAYVDVDDTVKPTFGYAKQAAVAATPL